MKLSELLEKLKDIADKENVRSAPFDPEIIFLTDKEVLRINFGTIGQLNHDQVIFLSEKRYHN